MTCPRAGVKTPGTTGPTRYVDPVDVDVDVDRPQRRPDLVG